MGQIAWIEASKRVDRAQAAGSIARLDRSVAGPRAVSWSPERAVWRNAPRRASLAPLMSMLFFFELFLFVLVMLTLALGEFVSRGLALTLWLVVTAFTLVGYLFARQSVKAILAGESVIPLARPVEPSADRGEPSESSEQSPPTEPSGFGAADPD